MDMKNTTYSYSEISNSIFKNIYTLFCGKQDCTPLYSFGPAIREYHLLHICTKGSGSFYANDYRYHIKKGQGFLIYPNELTFYQADEHTPWSYVWIAVSGEEVEKFLTLIGLSKQNPIFHCPDTERIASYIEDIMQHNTLSYSNEIYIEGVLMQLLSYLIESANTPYKEDQKNANIYINKAISYIHKNYQNPITVQEIADYLSLNRSYLTELFAKTVHFSPQQFLMKFRITKATEFLVDTELSIENIAYSCGYSNIYSFSKVFKKITGYSPSAYRKNKRIPEGERSRQRDPHMGEKLY